jgi:hypothetical protein
METQTETEIPVAMKPPANPRDVWRNLLAGARVRRDEILNGTEITPRARLTAGDAEHAAVLARGAATVRGLHSIAAQLAKHATLTRGAVFVAVDVPQHEVKPVPLDVFHGAWLGILPAHEYLAIEDAVPVAVAIEREMAERAREVEEVFLEIKAAEEKARADAETARRLAIADKAARERWDRLTDHQQAALHAAAKFPAGSTERSVLVALANAGSDNRRPLEADGDADLAPTVRRLINFGRPRVE